MQNSQNFVSKLLVLFFLLIFFTSSHIYYTQFLPQLTIFVLLGLYLVFLIFMINKLQIITTSSTQNLLLILVLILLIGELKHLVAIKFINWAVIITIMILVWSINEKIIESFLSKYLIIVSVILLISVFVMYGYLFDFNTYKYFSFIFHYDIYNRSINTASLPILHADSWINDWQPDIKKLTVIMPRIPAHFHQASLLSAYIFFPLGIAMLFTNLNSKIIFFILFLLLLSLSGSIYFIFIFSVLIYFFFNLIRYYNSILIILGILFIIVVSLAIRDIGYQIDTNTIDFANNHITNYFLRVGSGLYRLGILGNQIYMFFHNPLIGPVVANYQVLNEYLLGSFLFTNGIRSGIVAFSITLIILFSVTKELFKIQTNNFRQKYGICVIYACILQMFLYQDFGYNSTNGIILLSILILFINKISNRKT